MTSPVTTRVFQESDYHDVLALWQNAPGVEVAEGDDQEGIAQYLRRNPGLSRVAVDGTRIIGAVLCGHDGRRGLIYPWPSRPGGGAAALVDRWLLNASPDCAPQACGAY